MSEKKSTYCTFGQTHKHVIDGVIYDKDTVVKLESENPEEKMIEMFGYNWSHIYDELPDMKYYPRGIVTPEMRDRSADPKGNEHE